MSYRYYFMNRPPVEAYPLVIDNPAIGLYGSDIPYEVTDPIWGTSFHTYGFAEYNKPLDMETIWKYEISPADKVQWAKYRFYLWADRDILTMEAMIDDYVSHFDILKPDDDYYMPAKILKEVALG